MKSETDIISLTINNFDIGSPPGTRIFSLTGISGDKGKDKGKNQVWT
jgi:hypothetical protein